jgi:hypothetical protein
MQKILSTLKTLGKKDVTFFILPSDGNNIIIQETIIYVLDEAEKILDKILKNIPLYEKKRIE